MPASTHTAFNCAPLKSSVERASSSKLTSGLTFIFREWICTQASRGFELIQTRQTRLPESRIARVNQRQTFRPSRKPSKQGRCRPTANVIKLCGLFWYIRPPGLRGGLHVCRLRHSHVCSPIPKKASVSKPALSRKHADVKEGDI
jgi:hypothetical protein